MGHSIAACLLSAGHPVVAVTRSLERHRGTRRHVSALLRQMRREGLLRRDPGPLLHLFRISTDFADLADCEIVIESIIEDLETKQQTYRAVEAVVSPQTIIG